MNQAKLDLLNKCPQCLSNTFSDQQIKLILPLKDYLRYQTLQLRQTQLKSVEEMLKFCPQCDYAEIINKESNQFSCLTCNLNICPQCNSSPPHQGMTCEDNRKHKISKISSDLPEFEQLQIENTKPCPKCGFLIERSDGCNFMTCISTQCLRKSYFCYLCGMQLQYKQHFSHYRMKGPFGDTCNYGIVEQQLRKTDWRNFLFIYGFDGSKYEGSTYTGGMKTVEGGLLDAFVKSGLLKKENIGESKLELSRTSRVDKHVSALSCVLRARMPIKYSPEKIAQMIEPFLPDDIFLHEIQKTDNRGDIKEQVEKRLYYYYLPTFCLFSPDQHKQMQNLDLAPILNPAKELFDQKLNRHVTKQTLIEIMNREEHQSIFNQLYQTKIDNLKNEIIQNFNETLQPLYINEGKWYHNFISQKHAGAYRNKQVAFQSNFRKIDKFEIDQLITLPHSINPNLDVQPIQFVRFNIEGQSFGLQQIRNMIASVMEIYSAQGSLELLQQSFDKKNVKKFIKAPSQGIMLREAVFQKIQRKQSTEFQAIQASNEQFQKEVVQEKHEDYTQIQYSDLTYDKMNELQSHLENQIHSQEFNHKEFTFHYMQQLAQVDRTQALSKNVYLNEDQFKKLKDYKKFGYLKKNEKLNVIKTDQNQIQDAK